MSSNTLILIIVAVAIVAAAVVAFVLYRQHQEKRRRHLRDRFGPENERLVAATGDASIAQRELEARERRVAAFHIRPLSSQEREQFTVRWQQVQAEFVDNPKGSLAHADELLGEVMGTRGYPVQDFEQRANDLSVDHPLVVQHYHAAHGVALRHRKGEATTEDLRQAMVHYKALFEELVAEAPSRPRAAADIPHAAE
jgi:hypothetical protein